MQQQFESLELNLSVVEESVKSAAIRKQVFAEETILLMLTITLPQLSTELLDLLELSLTAVWQTYSTPVVPPRRSSTVLRSIVDKTPRRLVSSNSLSHFDVTNPYEIQGNTAYYFMEVPLSEAAKKKGSSIGPLQLEVGVHLEIIQEPEESGDNDDFSDSETEKEAEMLRKKTLSLKAACLVQVIPAILVQAKLTTLDFDARNVFVSVQVENVCDVAYALEELSVESIGCVFTEMFVWDACELSRGEVRCFAYKMLLPEHLLGEEFNPMITIKTAGMPKLSVVRDQIIKNFNRFQLGNLGGNKEEGKISLTFELEGNVKLEKEFSVKVFVVNRTRKTRKLEMRIAKQGFSQQVPPKDTGPMDELLFLKQYADYRHNVATVIALGETFELPALDRHACGFLQLPFIALKEGIHALPPIQIYDKEKEQVILTNYSPLEVMCTK